MNSKPLLLFTIGFTKKTAEAFFGTLKSVGIKRVVDVRLNNTGQLAGFTKRDDLAFFLHAICAIDYRHLQALAPTAEMLRAYRAGSSSWQEYAAAFTQLMKQRQTEMTLREEIRSHDCLLCSEPSAVHCHRRIAAEYLQEHWQNLQITHL